MPASLEGLAVGLRSVMARLLSMVNAPALAHQALELLLSDACPEAGTPAAPEAAVSSQVSSCFLQLIKYNGASVVAIKQVQWDLTVTVGLAALSTLTRQ